MVAAIAGVCSVAISGITAYTAIRTREDVQNVHTTFNSKMDKLLETTDRLARAEGRAQGIAEAEADAKSEEAEGDSPK